MVLKPIILLLAVISLLILASAQTESDILLKFKESLENDVALSSWTTAKPPCSGEEDNWAGLFCEQGRVWGLQLQNMGLEGIIDVESLARLSNLRTISLMDNNFNGPLPNLTRLSALKNIYLSNNKFSGEIPQNLFFGMLSLKKVHLASNKLSGPVPLSLAALPRLMELRLDSNEFVGQIPEFPQAGIEVFSVAHNELVGPIPASLSKFSASAFEGNRDLCGSPLRSCTTAAGKSIGNVIGMAIVVAAALASIIVVFVILSRRNQSLPKPDAEGPAGSHLDDLDRMEQGNSGSSSPEKPKKSEPSVKITFLREDRNKFDMSDLLKASAEILGSGVFGSTYKAALNDGDMMVVKRFRYMNNVNKEEFHEHMRRLGKMSHANVLPIVGFYYRKEEKLLVTDYAEKLSLANQLHGNRSRSSGRKCPDWATRLKIVKGVGRGLVYLHSELPSLTTPHGHLKSSNVLLDSSYAPLLTDYGLIPVVNQEYAQEHMISYRSPEYQQSGRITRKTDVWSLGVLVLEVMTGKYPSNVVQRAGADVDIVEWVEAAVREEDAEEVFDEDMTRSERSQGEMMKMLKIGLDCCEADVERRPDIKEAVRRIEEIREE